MTIATDGNPQQYTGDGTMKKPPCEAVRASAMAERGA